MTASGESAIRQLAALLPDFLKTQRWFRAKARTIANVGVEDVLTPPGTRSHIVVIRVDYAEKDHDTYVLCVRGDGTASAVSDALPEEEFRNFLLNAIACNTTLQGSAGRLIASRANALPYECGDSRLKPDSFVSRAEQSNTSIVYGDRFILKLFRKIESGINPDIEIGAFLTKSGFKHTPAVLGKLEYHAEHTGETYAAGILQEFVPNRGDAWKYTLEALNRFFDRALESSANAPALVSYHPLDLIERELSAETHEMLGSYLDSARLLGARTAGIHAALSSSSDPDFAPEPFTPDDGRKLYEEMLGQADIVFELLRRKQTVLHGGAAEYAGRLLKIEHRLMNLFAPVRDYPITAARIRFHGDFHLGQVLYTGDDFMIIDFEGEPARPLSRRRAKTLAMRDVAGMIRSFQYAAYTALSANPSMMGVLESWAAFWNAWVSAAYLKSYFDAARELPFVPRKPSETRLLFDAFLLQKALYEVAYELNNRPDWVAIPLRGILSLVN